MYNTIVIARTGRYIYTFEQQLKKPEKRQKLNIEAHSLRRTDFFSFVYIPSAIILGRLFHSQVALRPQNIAISYNIRISHSLQRCYSWQHLCCYSWSIPFTLSCSFMQDQRLLFLRIHSCFYTDLNEKHKKYVLSIEIPPPPRQRSSLSLFTFVLQLVRLVGGGGSVGRKTIVK